MRRLVVAGIGLALGLNACAPAEPERSPRRLRPQSEEAPATTSTATESPAPEAFRFAVIGDFGTGDSNQSGVAERICRRHARHPFDLVITTGDNIYPDGDPDRFRAAFFRPYSCLLDAGVRFRSTLGNHDILTNSGRPELREDAFGFKGRNYVVRKNGVRFVLVDSNALDGEWLRQATKTEEGDRWTVVAFHHPVYSPGTEHGSTPGFRPGLPRLFRRRGVDLVLNGHDHIYSVTRSLRRIRYVVTGGGGAATYGCTKQWFSQVCRERHHFLAVTATGEELVVDAIPPRGPRIDRFRTQGRD